MSTALLASRKSLNDLYGRVGYDNHARDYGEKNKSLHKFGIKELEGKLLAPKQDVQSFDLSKEIEATLIEDAEFTERGIKADMPLVSDLYNGNKLNGIYGTIAAFRSLRGSLQYSKAA